MTDQPISPVGGEETQPPPHLRGARSRYLPGGAFKPDNETLSRRQNQVLAWLRERGARGGTRIEAPDYLALSLSQRISELRSKGYRIDTIRERVGDTHVARYTLHNPLTRMLLAMRNPNEPALD